uniref:Sushi domain-containing protein n=1 Tax=Moschus moschiferus TaxID=68415 RepID=A0A8C6D1N1_MOSMO
MHWRRKWQPTPVFLLGESQGRGSLVGCPLWGKPCNYPVIKHGWLYYSYRGYFPARVNQQFVYYCDQNFVPPSQRSWDHLTCTFICIIFERGETVRVRCYEGYSLQNNQNTLTCTENGWSPPPRCIRVNSGGKCGPPPPIDNGDITSLPQSVYPPEMIVEYRCHTYYELRGNRNIVCRNGEWSEPPKCLDKQTCAISEEAMKKHHIQLRWKHDRKLYSRTEDNIEFMCQRGYRRVTPHHTFRTTCREGKVVYPQCEPIID